MKFSQLQEWYCISIDWMPNLIQLLIIKNDLENVKDKGVVHENNQKQHIYLMILSPNEECQIENCALCPRKGHTQILSIN